MSIFAIAGTILIPGCTSIKIAEYPAANTSFMYEKDDSVPFTDIASAPTNPDRGMRGEAYITLGSGEAYPGSGEDAYSFLDECLDRYSADGIKLMQIYVYLKEYCNDPLPETALRQLKEFLEYLNGRGVKALLRFAYESSESDEKGPRTRNILEHLETLRSFFDENAALIDKSVYAFQLGLIGLWGEGHGSVHNLNKRKIVKAAFETFPSDMFVMVRTPELLSLVPDEYERRAGLHDDYMIGYSHEWGMMDYSDENYPVLLNKCKYALTDGVSRGYEHGRHHRPSRRLRAEQSVHRTQLYRGRKRISDKTMAERIYRRSLSERQRLSLQSCVAYRRQNIGFRLP